jgi:hypothetical protein
VGAPLRARSLRQTAADTTPDAKTKTSVHYNARVLRPNLVRWCEVVHLVSRLSPQTLSPIRAGCEAANAPKTPGTQQIDSCRWSVRAEGIVREGAQGNGRSEAGPGGRGRAAARGEGASSALRPAATLLCNYKQKYTKVTARMCVLWAAAAGVRGAGCGLRGSRISQGWRAAGAWARRAPRRREVPSGGARASRTGSSERGGFVVVFPGRAGGGGARAKTAAGAAEGAAVASQPAGARVVVGRCLRALLARRAGAASGLCSEGGPPLRSSGPGRLCPCQKCSRAAATGKGSRPSLCAPGQEACPPRGGAGGGLTAEAGALEVPWILGGGMVGRRRACCGCKGTVLVHNRRRNQHGRRCWLGRAWCVE